MQKYCQFIVRKYNINLLWKQNNSKDKQSIISNTQLITESDKAAFYYPHYSTFT
jgi:hypothetical protein